MPFNTQERDEATQAGKMKVYNGAGFPEKSHLVAYDNMCNDDQGERTRVEVRLMYAYIS